MRFLKMPKVSRAELLVTGAAFFFSGASALVYQVAWQRILALHSGAGLYSIAMIVGAFMAGLGLGSYAGGVLSTRVTARRALVLFALLEGGIALFGAASVAFYYDGLSGAAADLYAAPVTAAVLHFLSLLPPTVLMGMSLPFLARAMVRDVAGASRAVGILYGLNVLGASAGALVTPWVLIRLWGVRGAVLAAVLGNVAAAAGALFALRGPRGPGGTAEPEGAGGPPTQAEDATRRPFALWMLLYAASGFLALSLEILWFRVMDVAIKSIAFTFGTLLFVYLLGNAAGSLYGVRWVERLRRPLSAFLLCQCALVAYAAAGIALLAYLPPQTPGYDWFFAHWSTLGGLRLRSFSTTLPNALRLYLVLPLVLFGPPTFLMGLSFPILQRAVHDDPKTSGRKVGFLQAANITGCLLGSLLVGLLLLDRIGTTGAFRVLLLLGLAFALLGLREEGGRSRFAAAAAVLVGLLVLMPGQERLWVRLHGLQGEPAFVEEDATGVAAITQWKRKDGLALWRVWVNGKSNSLLPFGGVHTALGALPAVIHDSPRRIAIIGLGSGDTAWAAGCRRDATEEVTVYEIIGPQKRLLEKLAATADPPPKLGRFLADARFRHLVADGRNAIDRGDALWDVIEMDAIYPNASGAGNLYSVEFFERCARKLAPGGLMCAWSPTARVYASFRAVFPYVLEFNERTVLVGSKDPIRLEPEVWRERLFAPLMQAYLGQGRAQELWRDYLAVARPAEALRGADLNHDLFPRDEFNTQTR
jgi:predicted membrane-bound spermidine synthase